MMKIQDMKNLENDISNVGDISNFNSKLELACNGSREDLDPYVPADHRPKEISTSSPGALAHLLKASLGSGVLAMPLAFKSAGWLVGAIGTITVGMASAHAIYIFVQTSQRLCVEKKRPFLGYAETCYLVFQNGPAKLQKFSTFTRELADWAIAVTHLGVCTVYIVVIGESFKQVSDFYKGPVWPVSIYCAMTLVVLVPLTQITKLKYLVPFSALANFIWLGSICVCMYYCLREPVDFSQRNPVTSISGIPSFISTSLFAMEGIGVIMPIENEMTKPDQFLGCPGVLNIAMSVIVLLYGFVGFLGYMCYGDAVRGSLTLNLPADEILAQTAKVLVACVMLLSFALIYYAPIEIIWRRLEPKVPKNNNRISLGGIRFVGVLFLAGLATAVPRLELFLNLVGAVCLSFLGLILPAVIEIIWKWNKNNLGAYYWVLWKNVFISLLALVALVSGVASAIYSI